MVSFPKRCHLRGTTTDLPFLFLDRLGGLEPTAPGKITPIPTTGRQTGAWAMCLPNGYVLWTLGGYSALFMVLGIFIFSVHHYGIWYGAAKGVPLAEKMIDMPLTPSQFRAAKYFLVVILLFLLQTSFGGLLAHYTDQSGQFLLPSLPTSFPTAGPRAGTCSWRYSGLPRPGSARPSTWPRSSAGSSPENKGCWCSPLCRDSRCCRRKPSG